MTTLQALTETYMTDLLSAALNTVMCDAQAIVELQPLRVAAIKELRNKYSFLSLAAAAAFIDYAFSQKLAANVFFARVHRKNLKPMGLRP